MEHNLHEEAWTQDAEQHEEAAAIEEAVEDFDEDIDERPGFAGFSPAAGGFSLAELAARAKAGIPVDGGIEFDTFGARAAEDMDAFVTDNRNSSEAKYNPIGEAGDEEKRVNAAKVVDWRETVAAMDAEARLNATRECLTRRDNYTPILRGLLDFCAEERSYEEIEEYLPTIPEFRLGGQSPRRYVYFLLRTGALDEIELGEDGEPVTQGMKDAAVAEGLDPEDVDTLIFDWRVVTTEVGTQIAEEFTPQNRIKKILAEYPDREANFMKLLKFCRTKRDFGQLEDYFRANASVIIDESTRLPLQIGSYVNKLGEVGALRWTDGWAITPEGEKVLEEHGIA